MQGGNKERQLAPAEYLLGMRLQDKPNPVITIVFYRGELPCSGCHSLYDMLDFNKENKKFVPSSVEVLGKFRSF